MLARQQSGELVHVRFDELLESEHHTRAPLRVCRCPTGLCRLCRRHGAVEIGRSAQHDGSLRFACVRVEHFSKALTDCVVATDPMGDLTHKPLPTSKNVHDSCHRRHHNANILTGHNGKIKSVIGGGRLDLCNRWAGTGPARLSEKRARYARLLSGESARYDALVVATAIEIQDGAAQSHTTAISQMGFRARGTSAMRLGLAIRAK